MINKKINKKINTIKTIYNNECMIISLEDGKKITFNFKWNCCAKIHFDEDNLYEFINDVKKGDVIYSIETIPNYGIKIITSKDSYNIAIYSANNGHYYSDLHFNYKTGKENNKIKISCCQLAVCKNE